MLAKRVARYLGCLIKKVIRKLNESFTQRGSGDEVEAVGSWQWEAKVECV